VCEQTGKLMTGLFITVLVFSIWACGVLVWSTLVYEGRDLGLRRGRGGIESVAISDRSLFEWAARHTNLVIFDVHLDRGIGGWTELTPYWLPLSTMDLPSLLEWLPPASKVVFCCRDAALQLDARTKTTLFERGIETVYFLDESRIFEPDHSGAPVAADQANREIGKKEH
jgi:hypothetical protein